MFLVLIRSHSLHQVITNSKSYIKSTNKKAMSCFQDMTRKARKYARDANLRYHGTLFY